MKNIFELFWVQKIVDIAFTPFYTLGVTGDQREVTLT